MLAEIPVNSTLLKTEMDMWTICFFTKNLFYVISGYSSSTEASGFRLELLGKKREFMGGVGRMDKGYASSPGGKEEDGEEEDGEVTPRAMTDAGKKIYHLFF